MAWEICITPETWAEIHEQLQKWDARDLAQAICDDEMESMRLNLEEMYEYEARRLPELMCCAHDVLVDEAFERIVQNNTCDNGGGAYWIDRDGCHKVVLE